MSRLSNEILALENKVVETKKNFVKSEIKFNELKNKYDILKLKFTTVISFVKQQYKFDINNLFEENENTLEIFSHPINDIVYYECKKEDKNEHNLLTKKPLNPIRYKKAVGVVYSPEIECNSSSDDHQEPVVEELVEEKVFDLTELREKITSIHDTQNIKNLRLARAQSKFNLADYIKEIKIDYDFFTSKKKNIATSSIKKIFTPLEILLLYLPKYTEIPLEIEHVIELENIIKKSITFPKINEKFIDNYFSQMHNQGLLYIDVIKYIDILLAHPLKFYNVIFLKTKKPTTDLYQFYIFQKYDKNVRKWNIDNRLISFSSQLINCLLPFAILLFRKIYFDIYNDNTFRSEFLTKHYMEKEFKQLLKTISLLSTPKIFTKQLQQLVIEKYSYHVTKDDKFDTQQDDILIKTDWEKDEIVFKNSF